MLEEMHIVDTVCLLEHVITQEEHLVSIHLRWDQPNSFFWNLDGFETMVPWKLSSIIEQTEKQDKLYFGCGNNVNNMLYFEFGSIIRESSNTTSMLELFDDAMGKKFMTKILKILIFFLLKTKIII